MVCTPHAVLDNFIRKHCLFTQSHSALVCFVPAVFAGWGTAGLHYARVESALRALVDRFLLHFNNTKADRMGYLIAIIIEEEDRAFNTVTE
jgi:hypothetical protein